MIKSSSSTNAHFADVFAIVLRTSASPLSHAAAELHRPGGIFGRKTRSQVERFHETCGLVQRGRVALIGIVQDRPDGNTLSHFSHVVQVRRRDLSGMQRHHVLHARLRRHGARGGGWTGDDHFDYLGRKIRTTDRRSAVPIILTCRLGNVANLRKPVRLTSCFLTRKISPADSRGGPRIKNGAADVWKTYGPGCRFGIGRFPCPIHFSLMESKDANSLTYEGAS